MKNVDVKWEKDVLTVKVDCAKEFGPSKSGKTTIIASTEGNASFTSPTGKTVTMGLNVYRK